MQEIATDASHPLHDSGEHVPKDILAFELSPERKLPQFVVTLKNVPGALEIVGEYCEAKSDPFCYFIVLPRTP